MNIPFFLVLRGTIQIKGERKEAWVSCKRACSISIKIDKLWNMTSRGMMTKALHHRITFSWPSMLKSNVWKINSKLSKCNQLITTLEEMIKFFSYTSRGDTTLSVYIKLDEFLITLFRVWTLPWKTRHTKNLIFLGILIFDNEETYGKEGLTG